MVKVCGLKVENMDSPLGIGVTKPRFSWRTESDIQGFIQDSYNIKLYEDTTCVWDSGKVESPESLNITGCPRLKSCTRYSWNVEVSSSGKQYLSEKAFFETGLLHKKWKALWITGIHNGDVKQPVNYLRKSFQLNKEIASARLYSSALGVYECSINGQKVSQDCMTPGWTDYFFRVQHQTYDVTNLLQQGNNAIGVKLGEGWYSGSISRRRNSNLPSYGTHPVFIGEIHITYTDGTKEYILSDKSWKCSIGGPERFSDIYDGELYDSRYNMGNWDHADFDDTGWSPTLNKNRRIEIVGVVSPAVRKMENVTPVKITEIAPQLWEKEPNIPSPTRVTIVDFGQNLVGKIKLKITIPNGVVLSIKHGEILKEDGSLHNNLRSARATVQIIGNGKEIEYEPLFTFFGFRYLQIGNLPQDFDPNSIVAQVMYTNLERTGEFKCSNELINQLYSNQLWSNKSNYLDLPTDCNQRDERLGWLGDAWIFADTASYNFNVAGFFAKYIADVNFSRTGFGEYPQYAPFFAINHLDAEFYGTDYYKGHNAWADGAIICPYVMYNKYNDKKILSDHYENMKTWIYFQEENSNNYIRCSCVWRDWLNHDDPSSESLLSTAYFAWGVDLMTKIATILGHHEDAEEFKDIFNKICQSYCNNFMKDGKLIETSQTAALLTLAFKLCPKEHENNVLEQLLDNIKENNYRLSTGFLGTPFLLPVLFQYNQGEIAERLLFQEEFPSWLYPVLQGATSIWERWDGYTIENGIKNEAMNSFNHYSYGSVASCFYSTLGGIAQDLRATGFRKVIIKPYFTKKLDFVETSYLSGYGKISTYWERKDNIVTLKVNIPANVTAKICLPNIPEQVVTSGNYTYTVQE